MSSVHMMDWLLFTYFHFFLFYLFNPLQEKVEYTIENVFFFILGRHVAGDSEQATPPDSPRCLTPSSHGNLKLESCVDSSKF
jgi:hypothetical protein